MDGFLVIDKGPGLSSHAVVARVRRILGQKKAGHTGTLDPFATGVLPVAVGEATKAIQFLDESEKEYRAVLRLGVSTDTQDLTGKVIAEADTGAITEEGLLEAAREFFGRLSQLPPMFSAIKKGGVPLYTLARKGVEVEREARAVEIHRLSFDWIRLPEACFTVRCSRGTYVRTLASDLGDRLGCGAHLLELRRTASGPFTEAQAITLEELEAAADPASLLVPLQEALCHLREFHLSEAGAVKVANGVPPAVTDLDDGSLGAGEKVRLSLGERLAAVAYLDPEKGMRLARVFN
ncbi:tRNA pseudouridine(55) synthase TruB [Geomesophilobacter sediminis]|uniref:tRNA pseudouridine synthase B n=1 Tax=Geomesophilobacter sediminis TaxID=2798584 RepID=A0A8J7SC16_9BACT|nr:tRNA pseudouridine(55) synthase TruB [Geomesophilobacter sediminis]MBJ6726749.1 tRNA pseudouridine(55) synthase TruB [Geomesophilobacter sediminis]